MSFAEHFSIANIPYGIATTNSNTKPSVVTRLEDTVIFLHVLAESGLLSDLSGQVLASFAQPVLNDLAAFSKSEQLKIRNSIQKLLSTTPVNALPQHAALPVSSVKLHLPISIGDFTDFSCSHDHVLNASQVVFGRRETPPGFLHFPVGYTGRTSSIIVSGTPIVRPHGQFLNTEQPAKVIYGPTKRLDYELEVAAVIGKRSSQGESVLIGDADEYIFGVVLLNDWSARDIQSFEMNPLGPLCGKSFATTISPWIITLEALAPFTAACPIRSPDIEIASYLQDPQPESSYSINLQATLQPAHPDTPATVICKTQFSTLYWTLRDLVAHQTVNGCNLNTGDLLATGTVSGSSNDSHGCLMELAPSGGVEVRMAGGGARKQVWLADGDTVSISAISGPGVGFGECVGKILPAKG